MIRTGMISTGIVLAAVAAVADVLRATEFGGPALAASAAGAVLLTIGITLYVLLATAGGSWRPRT